jgi:YD repeat-containing protein
MRLFIFAALFYLITPPIFACGVSSEFHEGGTHKVYRYTCKDSLDVVLACRDFAEARNYPASICPNGGSIGWIQTGTQTFDYAVFYLCDATQFLGPYSQTCRPDCGKESYLSADNSCKPLPPCPEGQSCVLPYAADPNQGNSCPVSGNPISTATGNKFQTENDFVWSRGLGFSRSYNSDSRIEQGLGIGWRHPFMRRIVAIEQTYFAAAPALDTDPDWIAHLSTRGASSNISHYLVEREDGKSFAFTPQGQAIASSAANPYQLTISGTGFTVKNGPSIETYNKSGLLTQITHANGQVLSLEYDRDQRLVQVKDQYEQQLSFKYESSMGLKQILLNNVPQLTFTYEKGRLIKVAYADNSSRQYLYEDVRNPYLLTGLIDENGQRYASWTYNEQGQAISSEHAGEVDKVSLLFGGDLATGVRWTDETDPLGSIRRYQFKQVAGQWLLSGKNQVGGAGCSAAASDLNYDTNGNVTSRTDFNGNKTTYVYDLARNLETSHTEAAGTPLARTVSTEWHATWRLPLKVTEPGRVTSFAYDAKANLLNKAITADGKTRSWSWTYADFGQVKTSTDPDGKTSSYQYDAQGHLTALTNAAQQMTQFTRYDANGNPLEILSPDGIKSILTYDARNRLISRQVGAALSGFEYWPTGLLKQATLPSGLVINYLYDAAHRLSEITDNQGHREVYTLNKAGLQEQVDRYDPDSTLANGLLQVQQAQSVKPAK